MGSSCCKSNDAKKYVIKHPMLISKTSSLSFKDPIANNFEVQGENDYKMKLNSQRWTTLRNQQKLPDTVLNGFSKIVTKTTLSNSMSNSLDQISPGIIIKKKKQSLYTTKIDLTSNARENSMPNTRNMAETDIYDKSDTNAAASSKRKSLFQAPTVVSKDQEQSKRFYTLKNGNPLKQSRFSKESSKDETLRNGLVKHITPQKFESSSRNLSIDGISESKVLV